MEKAEKFYYANKVETDVNKPKVSWDVIAEVLGNSKSERNIRHLIINSNTCNDDDIKANHANDFFTSIGHTLGQHFIDADSFFYRI